MMKNFSKNIGNKSETPSYISGNSILFTKNVPSLTLVQPLPDFFLLISW